MTAEDQNALTELEQRIKTILPPEYQDSYEDVQPVSMGSAGLKYGADGKVAWDQMWNTFCDLAMAGGPPHKGTLLKPGCATEIATRSEEYGRVVSELCRGIALVSDLEAKASASPGWIQVECEDECMSGWLLRAIVMENVSARSEGAILELPAAPSYRVEKEIKNVLTVIAKTCHYWVDHMFLSQQRKIAALFADMQRAQSLLSPEREGADEEAVHRLAAAIEQKTSLHSNAEHATDGWLGVECSSVKTAIWYMRALVATNILSRREGTTLFVPIDPSRDRDGERVVQVLAQIQRLAEYRGIR
jgi:sirohydrochlorin cobaltochelatase